MPAELVFFCAYARTYARFFSLFALGIYMLVVFKFAIVLVATLHKKYMFTDLQTTSIGFMGTVVCWTTSVCP